MKIIPVLYNIMSLGDFDITSINEIMFILSVYNESNILYFEKGEDTVFSIELCEVIYELIKSKYVINNEKNILKTNIKSNENVKNIVDIYNKINFRDMCRDSISIDNLSYKISKLF